MNIEIYGYGFLTAWEEDAAGVSSFHLLMDGWSIQLGRLLIRWYFPEK